MCHLLILDMKPVLQFLLSKLGDHAVSDLMESLIPSCRKHLLSTCLVPQCDDTQNKIGKRDAVSM